LLLLVVVIDRHECTLDRKPRFQLLFEGRELRRIQIDAYGDEPPIREALYQPADLSP
jgi:hypothetical protein